MKLNVHEFAFRPDGKIVVTLRMDTMHRFENYATVYLDEEKKIHSFFVYLPNFPKNVGKGCSQAHKFFNGTAVRVLKK